MRRRTLAEEWQHYHRTLYGGRLTGTQHKEVKTAFYAGFQTFYSMAIANAAQEDEAAAEAFYDRIDAELRDFAARVMRGDDITKPAPPHKPN